MGVKQCFVQVVHDARIVHSDLKPANFLCVKGRLKLIDFGIARTCGNNTTAIGGVDQGTMNFMSPEALQGGTRLFAACLHAIMLLYAKMVACSQHSVLHDIHVPVGQLTPTMCALCRKSWPCV